MKYSVWGSYYASKYLGEVEADTKEEALEKAETEDLDYYVTLCHQCSDEVEVGDLESFYVSEA
jgi:hypothetical protein